MISVKISVIIPFYNVEKYIVRCIESVKSQTFTDFECILIDDESPDNSYQIALEAIANDHRFKIIRQKNKGLGGARNTGIENAQGDYIAFLDSDDWWDNNFLELMYQSAVKNSADLVYCQIRQVDEQNNKSHFWQTPIGIYQDSKTIFDLLIKHHCAWDKLYKRELFEKVRFPEKRYFEDFATIYQLSKYTKKIEVIEHLLINYFIREGSITSGYSDKHIDDLIWSHKNINQNLNYDYFNELDILGTILERYYNFIPEKLIKDFYDGIKLKFSISILDIITIFKSKNGRKKALKAWLFYHFRIGLF